MLIKRNQAAVLVMFAYSFCVSVFGNPLPPSLSLSRAVISNKENTTYTEMEIRQSQEFTTMKETRAYADRRPYI